MAVTPNYSWPTPDNTDLVRDGAEAIRDLGNAIDATVFAIPPSAVLQVATATFTTAFTSTSTSFADTGVELSFTPLSATSNLIIQIYCDSDSFRNSLTLESRTGVVKLINDTTSTDINTTIVGRRLVAGSTALANTQHPFCQVSVVPSSATTLRLYKLQGRAGQTGTFFALQLSASRVGSMTITEVE